MERDVVFSCLLSSPSLIPAGWLFWMRLDLLMLGIMGEAPGSWPGLMGLAGLDIYTAKAEMLLHTWSPDNLNVFTLPSSLRARYCKRIPNQSYNILITCNVCEFTKRKQARTLPQYYSSAGLK